MSDPTIFTAAGGAGDPVRGTALVSRHAFSPRYDLDRATGVISRVEHDLAGESIAGRILVVPAAKGGVAAGWAIYALRAAGIAPEAFVFTTVNPVFVQGCVHASVPILYGCAPDPTTILKSGARLEVNPQNRTVEVLC